MTYQIIKDKIYSVDSQGFLVNFNERDEIFAVYNQNAMPVIIDNNTHELRINLT